MIHYYSFLEILLLSFLCCQCRSAPIAAIVEGYMTEFDPRHLVELEHAYIPQLLRRGEEEIGRKLLHNNSFV